MRRLIPPRGAIDVPVSVKVDEIGAVEVMRRGEEFLKEHPAAVDTA